MTDLNVQIQSSTLPNVQAELEKTTAEAREIQVPEPLKAKYAYLEKLGKGSQGQVWLAERKSDGERVAIKQLNVHSVTTWKQYELFKREAGILESLNFEGVVPFYEYVEDLEAKPPFVCIIQKHIEGQTLAEMLKAKHRFETHAIYDIIAQVLRILQKLHTHQPPVVHRDIKPSNLMLTPKENGRYQVTLLDFGAVANPQVQNGGSTVAGTFGYMPPEQLMGQAQPASDIYALAALAVELLSGTSPADIPVCDFKLVIEPHLTHVPVEVVQTLSMMLEPAMDNRICDHTALIAQFDALANKNQPSLLHFLRRTAVPKLEDVESICQPGNYEIWQNLDQKTDIALSKCPCHLDISQAKEHHKPPIAFIFNGIMLVLWIGLAILAFILFCMDKMSVGYFIALLILSIATGMSCSSQKQKLDNQSKLDCPNDLPKLQLTDDNLENFQLLIRHGQKVIGQITAIYYLNSDKMYSVHLFEQYKLHQISFDIPKFWVIYRFQYRDQQNLEFYGDLVTHTPPEGHYKVGDPITCMADISSLDDKRARLSVIPYPYPFGDVMNQDEILFSCDIDKKLLKNGDIMECDKQFELYWLSSIPYIHDNTDHDVVEIIPGKHLNYPTVMEFYKKLAEQLKQKSGDDEDILIKNVDIYLNKLHDNKTVDKLYLQLIEHYTSQFEAGDDEAILKAAEIYRDILADDIKFTNCHRLFAKRYLPKPDANADEMKSAIKNYQSKLKYENERICWQMVVMIWMDDYGLTIEKIWDKLKASYGSIDSYAFEKGMFTAFSYFNEDWLKAHQFDPQKAYKHIRGFDGTYDDYYMRWLREIWEYKKKYQNGNNKAAYNLYLNYSIRFNAYSDAKIWALRYYDADPQEYHKKYITYCDKKIRRSRGKAL